MQVLTELPIKSYFEQLFQQKSRNNNYGEILNRLISMQDEDPEHYGKFIMLKQNLPSTGEDVYYLYNIENGSVQKDANQSPLFQLINKPQNFVATNFTTIPIMNDNKTYVQINANQDIINHMEATWLSAHTTAPGTR